MKTIDYIPGAAKGRLIAWVPGRLSNPLNGAHGHWAAQSRDRKGWRERTMLCVRQAAQQSGTRLGRPGDHRGSPPWPSDWPKLIVLTAFVWNRYDDDGLRAACKPVVDGLRDADAIHDDGPKSQHRIEYRQQINRKRRGVEIVVQVLWPRRKRGAVMASEFRVVWKRDGLRSKAKRFATRRAAERLIFILTDAEPWRAYLRDGDGPDDYKCCSGYQCGCGGTTYRQEAEDTRANQPKLEWVRLEMREVGQWSPAVTPEGRGGT